MTKWLHNFFNDFSDIHEYYQYLVEQTKELKYVGISNEWVIDNFYLLVEHKTEVLKNKKEIQKMLSKTEGMYYPLKEMAMRNHYHLPFKVFLKELRQYQRENKRYFSYLEISSINTWLLIIYTNRLNQLCIEEKRKLQMQQEVSQIIEDNKNKEVSLQKFIRKDLPLSKNLDYVFEINNQLRDIGPKSNVLFKELNMRLKEEDISLREVVNDFYQKDIENDMLVANIFGDLKELFEISDELFYEKISYCEKLFMDDKIYRYMTEESKELYRKQLLKQASKKHQTAIEYLKSLYEKMDEGEHIGNLLFQHKNTQISVFLYLFFVILVSVLVSFYLSSIFLPFHILGFLLLLIPVSQLFIKILNEVLLRVVPTKPLLKMDYSKGIPETAKTMVAIPTIISSKEKISKMFDTLETFYLMNKTKNLYFTLLGDAKQEDMSEASYDRELVEYGEQLASSLNKKYKEDLFFFLYRKRVFNESEDCYLGYERKRGALNQFNKILLHRMSNKDIKKYFWNNPFSEFEEKIRYVITLDADNRLVLNTALNLVGAMAHPMNSPVLNKEKTKVISGYAMMQPRVSVDIEATNKSFYSQIFAGIGGFDTYSALVPNVYQDCFQEGSFIGKGIYDLEVFDQVLGEAFPDNLILSHDLLEGNYLRCAYVADVEIIDDFPSKFTMDITRMHRWARGDTQIIRYLLPKVENKEHEKVKNPLGLLGKFKILDNILRMFLYPSLLIILLCSFFITGSSPLIWILFVILEIALPIIFFLRSKMVYKKDDKTTVYYKNLMYGGKSVLLRSYILLASLPYYTKLYMDAFFRTLYRLLISHKNLLNWVTAEQAEILSKNNFGSYLKEFIPNIFLSILLLALGIIGDNIYAIIFSLIFLTAPFILYQISKPLSFSKSELSSKKNLDIREVAYRTWKYFKDNLREEYFYLIPDNYQENREEKLDLRTSPSALGFSLLSVVSARELDFITEKEAITLLEKILKSVESLPKWHGHLYNWYDIKTKNVMHPSFVSTVDSGNFIASLIIVREFLEQLDLEDNFLIKLCDRIINGANFKKLYTKKDVFSIGYDEEEGKLSIYNYNKFASESRLTSYIAICLGDAPSKHWFCLDKTLTTHKKHKGLVSWNGTSFEYFMPLLFMKNYPNTLLDETYKFAYFCQKDYVEGISKSLPWGMSESAYFELDNSLNYKYRAFGVPYLKAKEEKTSYIALSPYSSFMAMELFPEDVYQNMQKFEELGMLNTYGFYDAYDYDNKKTVPIYFAHHQGMSLVGFTNYLKKDVIKNYFHKYIGVRTFDILLKEKVQIKTSIDMKMDRYKKYNYSKEKIENDMRVFPYISYMPEVSVLSNTKYTLLMNDRGNSFSRYRTLQLNRYRKITEQDYGIFLYIRDCDSNKIWSNTYAPVNQKPEKYEVVFASDRIKFLRCDDNITTKTEIIVTKNHHAEIRKITFKNESDDVRTLELTTYTEPILSPNMDDVAHRVFNNMFLASEYDENTNSLIMRRKSRNGSNINSYLIERLVIDEPISNYSYETDRRYFIGRNRDATNPRGLEIELSNTTGPCLDPIISLRNKIKVFPNQSTTVYLINGFGRSREQLLDIVNSYDTLEKVEKAFQLATLNSVVNTKNLNITGQDMRTYNIMLNYLYQTTRLSVTDERMDLLRKNALGQSGLWKFGVSGDLPILLVEISDISDFSFLLEILKCFEYYKNNSIFIDLIILNNEQDEANKIIRKEVDEELYRIYALHSFSHTPGKVIVLDEREVEKEEKSLLEMVARLKFMIKNHESLEECVSKLQDKNYVSDYEKSDIQKCICENKMTEKLSFDNGYGGFRKNGAEYVIYNKDTPVSWSNVISNKNFGTIVTNNGCGFTYAYNSGEFKITSWTNDVLLNDKSEGILINHEQFDPSICIHGFGYSIFKQETKSLKEEITEFVAKEDSIKFYLCRFQNKEEKAQTIDLEFWINPTFGNFEEKTSRHILAEFDKTRNCLNMRNVYSIQYSDVNVFMSSSEELISAKTDYLLTKSIRISIALDAGEEKEFAFFLGCSRSLDENLKWINTYKDISNVQKELRKVKKHWQDTLSIVQVETPDKSFNYMMNGWYLYQTLSSRITAKTGFYQVSGAFGYRDQLQDAMNLVEIMPEVTKNQILINASHQFVQGDVLHWWHEKNHFGLRSRYKDDYLWLVYATILYLERTNDYSILDEEVFYIAGEELSTYEQEKGISFTYKEKGTLLEHLLKSINLSISSISKRGLPLMGGGDWNDGMNQVGAKGKGESIWLGFFLYFLIDNFTKIMKNVDKNLDLEKYLEFNKKLKNNLNTLAWDGEYYLRAFFDNGDKLGSHENKECKIDLISQSFAILSEVAPKTRIPLIFKSVEDNLVDNNLKIIKLLTPAFEKSLNNPGYIMSYPKGIRENGGQYTHATAWYLMALLKEGKNDLAYKYYQMINPINRTLNKSDCDTYLVEPYVIAADIYSSDKYPARGGWTWYTGSSGWYFEVGLKDICGFSIHGEILEINPKIPDAWDAYKITYKYKSSKYKIEITKGNKALIEVDNKKVSSGKIGLVDDGREHEVKVVISKNGGKSKKN